MLITCSGMLQEPTVGDVNAAKVHMSAPGNTNVYVGNLPVEVRSPVPVRSASCSLHMFQPLPLGGIFASPQAMRNRLSSAVRDPAQPAHML